MKALFNYKKHTAQDNPLPKYNLWDGLVFCLMIAILTAFSWSGEQMAAPYELGKAIKIQLDPYMLPVYGLRTVTRMFIALGISLLFSLLTGLLAAKNRKLELLLLPTIDIFQSIPILGIQSMTLVTFVTLFKHSLLGPECAAIFTIFMSQVWNITLSFYQSLKTLPEQWRDLATAFQLSGWQKFWKIEVPYAIPGLVWNSMVSMSAGWFFVVASEAISVANQEITLPGIGSYIHLAIRTSDLQAIGYSALALLLIIVVYDQLFFRPLLAWSDKFLLDTDPNQSNHQSWFYDILNKTLWIKNNISPQSLNWKKFFFNPSIKTKQYKLPKLFQFSMLRILFKKLYLHKVLYHLFVVGIIAWMSYSISVFYMRHAATIDFFSELCLLAKLGAITCLKVVVLVILASLVLVPLGVWIGFKPHWAKIALPIAQFLAAFPANLLWPIFFIAITKYDLSVDIFSSLLMILGNQWYILFNVISGTLTIPQELKIACKSFKIKGLLAWRAFILPAIFPSFVTGAMAAAGGCWNAAIIADVLEWGDQKLIAKGLGSYIVLHTNLGDFPRIMLGLIVMCIYVIIMNRFIWQKCYDLAADRFTIHR